MNKIETKFFIRITKAEARKRYNNNLLVYALPCKLSPENIWTSPHVITQLLDETFEQKVNNYTYYNCNNECGKYPAFYVKKEKTK